MHKCKEVVVTVVVELAAILTLGVRILLTEEKTSLCLPEV